MPLPATLSDLIAALPLATVVVDRGERIAALNAPAEALLGRSLLGRHFITGLRQPALVDGVEQTLRDGQRRQCAFVARQRGADVSFDVTLAPIGPEGQVLISFADVTRMAQADRMRRDFVANVSHELRTPLTSMIGFIETLQGPARDDPAAHARFLGIMADEAGRMNRLVDDLLSLSKVEEAERQPPTQRVDLCHVVTTAVRNLSVRAGEGGVALDASLGAAPIPVLGDADQLVQVFTNLIENAVKYGRAGKRVEITARTSRNDPAVRGPAARVEVRDFGPGISPQHLPRLTERFYRADSHRSREQGGTGLGLAIVKHILNRHGGRLKITSDLGRGAVFRVILPLHEVV